MYERALIKQVGIMYERALIKQLGDNHVWIQDVGVIKMDTLRELAEKVKALPRQPMTMPEILAILEVKDRTLRRAMKMLLINHGWKHTPRWCPPPKIDDIPF